jgi:heat-inducible transcriptional repressor
MTRRTLTEEFNQRSQTILNSLIREFIRTGKPVGSRRLAKSSPEGLSSATIRNVVADLEDMGLVTQPHTSAGRVPTPLGYRFFVDHLTKSRQLSDRQVDRIRKALEKENNPGELMNRTSQILSQLSTNVGFVLVPPLSLTVMKHIEFVKISPRRILVILVNQAGLLQQKIIRVTEDLKQRELDQASRYLAENYEGKTLLQVREDLIHLMTEERSLYNRMLQNVILLGSKSLLLEDPDDESEVYLGGTSHIIEKVELGDRTQVIALFQAFEEKNRLIRILTECVREDHVGPSVTIGLEKHLPGMEDFALISAPYSYDSGATGTLGVLGPSRMEYEKAISLVDCMAKLFGNLLTGSEESN